MKTKATHHTQPANSLCLTTSPRHLPENGHSNTRVVRPLQEAIIIVVGLAGSGYTRMVMMAYPSFRWLE